MKYVSAPRKRSALRALLLPLVLVAAFATVFLGPGAGTASAAPVCTNDLQGADDEPGQKDLTLHCVDSAGLPGSLSASYQFDDTGTSGTNKLNACLLFDNDANGLVDAAVCVTTGNDPALLEATRVFTCDDTSADHCLGETAVSNPQTTCSVGTGTNPFNGNTDARVDCNVVLADFGGGVLVNTCSYPSQSLTSDESDCIITDDGGVSAATFRTASATKAPGSVLLRWKTGAEVNVLGYNVYVERNGKRVKANSSLIAGKGVTGGNYAFRYKVPKGKKAPARFWIQTVDVDGTRSWRSVRAS